MVGVHLCASPSAGPRLSAYQRNGLEHSHCISAFLPYWRTKMCLLKGNLAGESLWNSFITLGMSPSHLSSICSPHTWQEGSIVKTRKDQGFHPTVNIPSNSAVMRFKTDAETDGFTSSSPWKHFESPVGSFLPFGHLVFYLLWLFLATTAAAAVCNKSEEGWEAWALDRSEAERLLLDVEESFAAAALDKEWPMERERGSERTKCWQNVETEPVWGQTVFYSIHVCSKDVIQRVCCKYCWEVF